MKVTYNKTKNAYQVIYKDELAALAGKPLYARKQVTAGKTRPTATERKAKIRELEQWAAEQEELLKKAAQEKIAGDTKLEEIGEKPILAIDYLENLSGDNLTTTRKIEQIKAALLHIKDFIIFLKERYQGIYLHKINRKIALEFANWMTEQKRSFAYKKARWVRLGYVFNRVMINNEESDLPYKNPFWTLKVEDVAEEEPVIHKKTFTPEVVKTLLEEALTTDTTQFKKQSKNFLFQRYAILYIMTLTGIRPKDLILLKWEQIDMENRTLTIEHNKTKRKGIRSVIFLTAHLLELFNILQGMHKTEKTCSKEYVFSFNPCDRKSDKTSMSDYLYTSTKSDMADFFVEFRKKHNLTQSVKTAGKKLMAYSMYSLRGTVGTILSNANFNMNNIDYLQGHAPNNTTARFYLDREADPEAATAEMINYMAYRVAQQPLGKYGLKVAYLDAQRHAQQAQKQLEIDSEMRYTNDGTKLLTHTLLEKVEAERAAREELIKKYGEDLGNFLQEH